MLFWLSFLPEWQAWIGTLGLLKAMKLNSSPKEKKKCPLLADSHFSVSFDVVQFDLNFSLTICYTILFCFHKVLISLNCKQFEMPL